LLNVALVGCNGTINCRWPHLFHPRNLRRSNRHCAQSPCRPQISPEQPPRGKRRREPRDVNGMEATVQTGSPTEAAAFAPSSSTTGSRTSRGPTIPRAGTCSTMCWFRPGAV